MNGSALRDRTGGFHNDLRAVCRGKPWDTGYPAIPGDRRLLYLAALVFSTTNHCFCTCSCSFYTPTHSTDTHTHGDLQKVYLPKYLKASCRGKLEVINGTEFRALHFSFFNVIIMLLSIKSIFSAQQRKGISANHQFLLGCTEQSGNNKSGGKKRKKGLKNTFMEQYFYKWVINIWLAGVEERRRQLPYRQTCFNASLALVCSSIFS